MKLAKVLKILLELEKVKLSMYQIAKASDLHANAVTRIANEQTTDPTYSTITRIANGLGKIQPYLKPFFYALMEMDDNIPLNPHDLGSRLPTDPAERPEAIAMMIQAMISLGIITKQQIDDVTQEDETRCLPDVPTRISLEMIRLRNLYKEK